MPMRGDDLLAISVQGSQISFLKGESKSRTSLSGSVLCEARRTLDANSERPSPHALAFLSDRLAEEGYEDIADRINDAQYRDGLPASALAHLVFTFSGNNPTTLLRKHLLDYNGQVSQLFVGVQVPAHRSFITHVYQEALQNGHA